MTDLTDDISNGDWRFLLNDKVVFITGGAGWIARHIAKTCYEHGARIVLADRNIETIIQVKNETFGSIETDERILPVQIDLLNEESIAKAVESTLNQWKTIDILINTFVKKPIEFTKPLLHSFVEQRYLLLALWKMFPQMIGRRFLMSTYVVMH